MKIRSWSPLGALVCLTLTNFACSPDSSTQSPTVPMTTPDTFTITDTAIFESATDTVTPVPAPTLPEGPMTFDEPFIDNRNNWYTNPTLVEVFAGVYNHVLDCPAAGYSTHCGNFIKIPFAFPRSFRMQMETTITSASTDAGVMVGFQLRRSDDSYYYVNYVITKGLYEISRVTQTGAFTILSETPTDFIAQGVGETNVLGIEIKGADLMPLLNGNQISPVQDGNIRTAGDSYLVVLVERGHTAEVQFDNLVVEIIE